MKRALLVDDEDDLVLFLTMTLKRAGLVSNAAFTLAQARELLEENDYDVVLVDLLLGPESGWDLVRHIRSDPRMRELPIVVISAWTATSTVAECERWNCAYLPKPFTHDELRSVLDARIDRR